MTDINEKILRAIEDDALGAPLTEADATAIGLIPSSFKGTFRYTMTFVVILQLCIGGLAVYCAYQMFDTEILSLKIEWLSGLIISFMIFAIARLWFFMELNRLSILREMKRLEMQVTLTSKKINP